MNVIDGRPYKVYLAAGRDCGQGHTGPPYTVKFVGEMDAIALVRYEMGLNEDCETRPFDLLLDDAWLADEHLGALAPRRTRSHHIAVLV